ncbi:MULTISPECIES: DUF2892 domain-containing protein [unclassified Mariprofundus]|jgi:hypothetical protein|uniref:YgaP family membrane protein n=1 Tax=unclassified Mariprofundus TaxID=2619007 RepID=UPI0015A3CDC9|nr:MULTISPECIES: DUF2892 domain-containing protein [unclassified Mariprofundus]NWF37020.1 DUF2892 domain-containing protein [Mariprofundus sp. KV]NWF39688.1 DUF2892 domain-containing protein [Mariprofundus sp. NF]
MKANVGTIDRVLRLVAGAALIAFGYMGGLASPWNAVAIGAGSVFVLTALIKFCPLYPLLGINTCSK